MDGRVGSVSSPGLGAIPFTLGLLAIYSLHSSGWRQTVTSDSVTSRFATGTSSQELDRGKMLRVGFANQVREWIHSIRQNVSHHPIQLGQGEGHTEVQCYLIAPNSKTLCDKIKNVVESEIDIEAKRLATFLLHILNGNEDQAIAMAPGLGGYQIFDWEREFENESQNTRWLKHPPWSYGPVVSFGGGAGAGFQVSCNHTLLLSAGGGGGGGVEVGQGLGGYSGGGGGGVRIYPAGVAGGISMGMGSNGTISRFDADTDRMLFNHALGEMRHRIRTCPPEQLKLRGGGGGGGGITIRVLPSAPKHVRANATRGLRGEEVTYSLGYFYFYFSDAQAERGGDGGDSCDHIPCSQWVHFGKYIRGGPCAARNVSCKPH
ncbi:hypothetical protein AAMO2058_001582100 [Amorphochlora amoebiformis]